MWCTRLIHYRRSLRLCLLGFCFCFCPSGIDQRRQKARQKSCWQAQAQEALGDETENAHQTLSSPKVHRYDA
jgi:hypothetical protein